MHQLHVQRYPQLAVAGNGNGRNRRPMAVSAGGAGRRRWPNDPDDLLHDIQGLEKDPAQPPWVWQKIRNRVRQQLPEEFSSVVTHLKNAEEYACATRPIPSAARIELGCAKAGIRKASQAFRRLRCGLHLWLYPNN